MAKQDGLEWIMETFGLEPRWTRDPDTAKIEQLARKHLHIAPNSPCTIKFHARGAFNKLYKIETETRNALMRVTLPVDPHNKTNSEVATIDFVREFTDMLVPQIFAFDDSNEIELGFEWILMELLPGGTLRSKWRKMSGDRKRDLVKQVVKYQAQLFRHRFEAVGNIFFDFEAQSTLDIVTSTPPVIKEPRENPLPTIGQLVSMIFFWGNHINQNVPRGPFTNSEDWIRARLTLILTDQETILSTSTDEDEIEDAQSAKDIAKRLLKMLPKIFPPDTPPETTILFHDDLSMQNILVDDNEKITGVIDWECVSALPLWRACQLPQFLEGRERNEEPKREQYALDDGKEEDEGEKEPLDNESMNSLYWEHLMEYELTQLRLLFREEMRIVAPEWIQEMQSGAEKADFEDAVRNCDNGWRSSTVVAWLDAREKGEKWSLRKKMFE
ncbi:kinase-like protein [Mollisia scopiformis]|uniref:Kinase-like protein n=1 Tax=Mollisia scopiformis TaxID=149040 RepID=A0A132B4U2_MOLSC|nr:kinase-like protein [Mollisia scopiformis]KUJ07009.1 kinase-like protein [Mollisia scopiformis]